jgi:phenylpropionate dioxygenase-like ring-hydroxylating dioxygenase large terminal subunit
MTFLRNTWYVAANTYEFENDAVVSRTICNEKVAMWRNSDGSIAAILDRCPHRFVPLSMGNRVGDTLQCGYHGLRFDGTGACVEAPHDDDSQKARACVKGYAIVERYKVAWLWLGEPEMATPDTIPDFSYMEDEVNYTLSQGYTLIKGNYQLISDNLLDLSHIHYLHPSIHAGSNFEDFTNKVKKEGDTVYSMLWRHHYHVDAARRPAEVPGDASDVEGQGHSRWDVPGVLFVDTAWWDHGKTIDEGVRTPNSHLITPETETSSHYFFASGRNFARDNEQITKGTVTMMQTVFDTQDGPMIEAQQADMGDSTDFLDHQPIILKADAAGVMARRLMKKKIRDEQALLSGTQIAAE